MEMIVHQHMGMDGNGVRARGVIQQIKEVLSILIVDEDGPPIHPTLRDMKWKRCGPCFRQMDMGAILV